MLSGEHIKITDRGVSPFNRNHLECSQMASIFLACQIDNISLFSRLQVFVVPNPRHVFNNG
jgi:hypothetical protein